MLNPVGVFIYPAHLLVTHNAPDEMISQWTDKSVDSKMI